MNPMKNKKSTVDILSVCMQVFFFSLSTNRGEHPDYEGALTCSGEERE